ncbi:TetR/AcrR family transcriptional regulator [Rhodococcus sp. ARC_M8]|uniref:TetR/AcrR family transcriptional regulator n=1 Tax=Rhodococcus sp. ARC_M8 TaxID=2928853 RepID=UPI001FB4315F|nr:TetR/AcrR family transcriptional regulator [Rhodococcus sp. ARC_M8]MCJ0949985.1 TetR/AcrR family transcriptional regulator [Rhodococcus sp. ARC_M8]
MSITSNVSGDQDESEPVPSDVVTRLYPAALRTFAERDFHAVGMREVSSAAGVSTATIYKYFGSKEALLLAVLHHGLDAIDARLRANISHADTPRDQWRACFQTLMEYYDADPEFAIIYFITVPSKIWITSGSWASFGSADFLHALAERHQRDGDLDPTLTSSMITSVVFMLATREVQLWFYRERTWRLTDRIDHMIAFFWNAVSNTVRSKDDSDTPEKLLRQH